MDLKTVWSAWLGGCIRFWRRTTKTLRDMGRARPNRWRISSDTWTTRPGSGWHQKRAWICHWPHAVTRTASRSNTRSAHQPESDRDQKRAIHRRKALDNGHRSWKTYSWVGLFRRTISERKEQIYQYLKTTNNTRHLRIIREQILVFSATQCRPTLGATFRGDLINFTDVSEFELRIYPRALCRLELVFFAVSNSFNNWIKTTSTKGQLTGPSKGRDQTSTNWQQDQRNLLHRPAELGEGAFWRTPPPSLRRININVFTKDNRSLKMTTIS